MLRVTHLLQTKQISSFSDSWFAKNLFIWSKIVVPVGSVRIRRHRGLSSASPSFCVWIEFTPGCFRFTYHICFWAWQVDLFWRLINMVIVSRMRCSSAWRTWRNCPSSSTFEKFKLIHSAEFCLQGKNLVSRKWSAFQFYWLKKILKINIAYYWKKNVEKLSF